MSADDPTQNPEHEPDEPQESPITGPDYVPTSVEPTPNPPGSPPSSPEPASRGRGARPPDFDARPGDTIHVRVVLNQLVKGQDTQVRMSYTPPILRGPPVVTLKVGEHYKDFTVTALSPNVRREVKIRATGNKDKWKENENRVHVRTGGDRMSADNPNQNPNQEPPLDPDAPKAPSTGPDYVPTSIDPVPPPPPPGPFLPRSRAHKGGWNPVVCVVHTDAHPDWPAQQAFRFQVSYSLPGGGNVNTVVDLKRSDSGFTINPAQMAGCFQMITHPVTADTVVLITVTARHQPNTSYEIEFTVTVNH
jgi:hypothetical protein